MTGGWDRENGQTNRVVVYDVDGFVEYLPNLFTKRMDHGCGHYVDSDDKIVGHKLSTFSFNTVLI